MGLQLSAGVIEREKSFIDELLRWNQRINLTSIRTYDEAVEKHLLDSLLLLAHLDGVGDLLDMGSGGGLPGIPLAIADSTLNVVSVDSVGKKINFQKHIKRLLQLDNLTALNSRIEDLEKTVLGQRKYDLVVSRAFSSLEVFLGYAAPWLKPGGRLIAMKGPEGRGELEAARQAIERYSFIDSTVFVYNLPFSRAERQLIILTK